MRTFLKWAGVAVVFLVIGAALSPTKRHNRSGPARHAAGATELRAASTPAAAHRRHRRHPRAVSATASATPTATATVTATPAFVACDANIRARAATTTCRFAENVFYEYYEKSLGHPTSTSVRAWSPAAASFFRVDCLHGTVVHCVAGDGAEIRFASGAAAAYDDKQAAAYAASHDTGAADRAADAPPTASDDSSQASGSGCDTNYAGACLDPSSPDYDCQGGSGDGPDYTGEVRVVGGDHYDLDRDGDGVGCEPY